jgi:hypothetical protein
MTLPARRGARTVRITQHGKNLRIEGSADSTLTKTVAHMFRLDEDLSEFYELVRDDELAWCALGAGRMLRAPTVFEDVVKTICTLIRSLSPQNRGCTGSANGTLADKPRRWDRRPRGDPFSRSSRIRTPRQNAEESISPWSGRPSGLPVVAMFRSRFR